MWNPGRRKVCGCCDRGSTDGGWLVTGLAGEVDDGDEGWCNCVIMITRFMLKLALSFSFLWYGLCRGVTLNVSFSPYPLTLWGAVIQVAITTFDGLSWRAGRFLVFSWHIFEPIVQRYEAGVWFGNCLEQIDHHNSNPSAVDPSQFTRHWGLQSCSERVNRLADRKRKT